MTNSLLFPEMEPLPGLNFPEPLSDRYRPRRIEDFAGLSEPKKILSGFVKAPRNCGFLFVGPPGTGKTSMAQAVSAQLRGFVHHVTAGNCTVETARALGMKCWYFPPTGYDYHAILIDEADLMSREAQNVFLSYLDGTNTIPNTIFFFTCNSTERLEERFQSRNRVLKFSTYAIQEEAAELLERVWTLEAPADLPKPNFARIIKDETGNVRAALSTLESKLDAARAA